MPLAHQDPKDTVEDAPVVHTRHAAWLIREEQPDGGPFIFREFIPHDSRLRFRSLNHANADDFNTEPVFPRLPANRTYRGRGKTDQIDPKKRTSGARACFARGIAKVYRLASAPRVPMK